MARVAFIRYLRDVMLVKTRGIVLHTIRYSDSRLIADIYTESHGVLGFIVRVPSSKRSSLRTLLLSPLAILELDFDYREGKNLLTLKDLRLSEAYVSIPYHPVKETIALFLGEFLYYTLRFERQGEGLFRFLRASMLWLDRREEDFANFPVACLISLTHYVGVLPNEEEMSQLVRPEEMRYLPYLLRMNYMNMHFFRFTSAQRARVLQVVIDYYRLHIPGFPELKSIAILRELLS